MSGPGKVLSRRLSEAEAAQIRANIKEANEQRKVIRHVLTVQLGFSRPPWMSNEFEKSHDGPQVEYARKLMQTKFPQGEWRTKGPRAVRHTCQELATERPLPSADSFAKAMGRRKSK